MITVEGIRKKASNKYNEYLRSVIEERSIFPWTVPSDKSTDKEYINRIEQVTHIIDNSKTVKGYGYAYEFDKNGNKIISIKFDTADDYLKFINKEDEVRNFKEDFYNVTLEYPVLKELLLESPKTVINNHEKWNDLLKVCRYFQSNAHAGLYMRQLPAKVHSKFIENNTEIIFNLLDKIDPELINYRAEKFEDKLGLKSKHNLIRIRFLDDTLQVLPGHEEIGIAEIEINKLNINCRRVFVIENDIPALIFPKIESSIILFGKGYNVAALKNVQWLNKAEVYYWGDFDTDGLEILSQIRGYFPHVKSFLMDLDTLLSCKSTEEDWPAGPKPKNRKVTNLTAHEELTYKYIQRCDPPIRFEQEYIPQQRVHEELKRILG